MWFAGSEPSSDQAYYCVPAGLMDDKMNLEVGAHLFVASKALWDIIPAGGRQYEAMPEFSEFIRLLHAER
jgi:hypothetical protein